MINVLNRTAELDIHVTVDADQAAFVLCLAPFETDDDFFVDSMTRRSLVESQRGLGEGMGSEALSFCDALKTYKFCSMGRGLMGMTCSANISTGSRRKWAYSHSLWAMYRGRLQSYQVGGMSRGLWLA
jgi:hypothetical protein